VVVRIRKFRRFMGTLTGSQSKKKGRLATSTRRPRLRI